LSAVAGPRLPPFGVTWADWEPFNHCRARYCGPCVQSAGKPGKRHATPPKQRESAIRQCRKTLERPRRDHTPCGVPSIAWCTSRNKAGVIVGWGNRTGPTSLRLSSHTRGPDAYCSAYPRRRSDADRPIRLPPRRAGGESRQASRQCRPVRVGRIESALGASGVRRAKGGSSFRELICFTALVDFGLIPKHQRQRWQIFVDSNGYVWSVPVLKGLDAISASTF
jgi:hypothetical protein